MTQKVTTDPIPDVVEQSTVSIHGLLGKLEEYFKALTPAQREHLAVVPGTFASVAGPMLEAVAAKPTILAACPGFDAAKVQTQLQYAALLAPLANQIDQLKTLVDDSLRTNLVGAYTALLPVYNTAKSAARYDTTLQPIVAPMEEMYASRKPRKPKAA